MSEMLEGLLGFCMRFTTGPPDPLRLFKPWYKPYQTLLGSLLTRRTGSAVVASSHQLCVHRHGSMGYCCSLLSVGAALISPLPQGSHTPHLPSVLQLSHQICAIRHRSGRNVVKPQQSCSSEEWRWILTPLWVHRS